MLTESEVERSFRKLFRGQQISPELIERGDQLIDELRAESPLRHRLSRELDELRQLSASRK